MTKWQHSTIALPNNIKEALKQNQRGQVTHFNATATGVKFGVHNWTHGKKEQSNSYLSPENAVNAIAKKLTDFNDDNRPTGQQEFVVLMITRSSINAFIQDLESITQIMQEPVFKQSLAYAKASKNLNKTKMVKTSALSSPCFSQQADITPSFARTIQTVMRNATALANSATQQNLDNAINGLKALKKQQDKSNNEKVKALLSARCQLFSFVAKGELSQIATQLKQNLPSQGNPFTACLVFIGQDLTNIKGLINAN
ncbi:hypothetical protein QJU93_10025 [Pasteurella skyensis]|uniref:Uncharacterized protein n=1 Tax=Phocoenobacter skyensis TaxID=97481 RepID=A0AAJ6NBC8_9PAST|nr:hypothetical protein [Pasteurella skyensis]MDP8173692.1 hypothetical protein [Pasteurella skyensis]MDP8178060.1 hypothetical protein [Pasteurella skyensis]